jgi:hypothetical protein
MADMPTSPNSAARLRETLLAQFAERLEQLIPDDPSQAPRSFDEIEAAAVRLGDQTTCAIMSSSVQHVLDDLPQCTKQGRCKCGRNLQWSDKPRTLETIRGPVTITRLHGYCRECDRGFFPRGTAHSSAGQPP